MQKNYNSQVYKAFEAIRDLMRCSDFVDTYSMYWNEDFLKEMFLIALDEIEDLDYLLCWLNYTAHRIQEEEPFKKIFRKEFPKLTEKYTMAEIFDTLSEYHDWFYLLKNETWCAELLEKYANKLISCNDYIAAGSYSIICCKDEKKACILYIEAEDISKTFKELYTLGWALIHELKDPLWAHEVILKLSRKMTDIEEAGKVLSLASFLKDFDNGDTLYRKYRVKY